MRFRRRADDDAFDDDAIDDEGLADDAGDALSSGPFDSTELPDDAERIDLGSLLVRPEEDQALQIQVDNATGEVQAVLLAGPDGAVELRAFAAARNGDLWGEVRPKIAADLAQSGGVASEREGPFGTELLVQVGTGQGNEVQTSRVIGINGPRWMLRATLYGRPAAQPESASDWEASIRRVAVHRGAHAVPPGEALPVVVPQQAQQDQQSP